MFSGPEEAIRHLHELIQPNDLVLIKGSRAVGMDQIVTQITQEKVDTYGLSAYPRYHQLFHRRDVGQTPD